MKLVRYGTKNAEKPGVIDGGGILRDLSNEIDEITPNIISPSGLKSLLSIDVETLPKVSGNPRLGVPLFGIPKIVAIGQNYMNHILEMCYTLVTKIENIIKQNSCNKKKQTNIFFAKYV